MLKLAPSLLAADFWNLGEAVTDVVDAGAQVLHIDVMDGHQVPNLSMGPGIVAALKGRTRAVLDVHLMVTDPDNFIEPFSRAGAGWISFHIEAARHAHRTCETIQALGCKAGIAINPGTPIQALETMIRFVDFVLLMSVNPGFGGQSFIQDTYRRLGRLRELIAQVPNRPFIQVDGGVGPDNIRALHEAGMDVAVAGSSVFRHPSPGQAVKELLAAVGVSS